MLDISILLRVLLHIKYTIAILVVWDDNVLELKKPG